MRPNEQLGAGSEARGSFAPTVKMPGGEVVSPEGWMWVLGFALGGCQWAIDEAERMGLQQKAADYRRRQSLYWAELEVAALEARLTEQRALVAQLQAPNAELTGAPR